MINETLLNSVCCLNSGGKQCRYLARIENSDIYNCLKKTKNKLIIDNIIKDTKSKFSSSPIGDNCPGITCQMPDKLLNWFKNF